MNQVRATRARELAALPPWGTAECEHVLFAARPAYGLSTHAALLRRAQAAGRRDLVEHLFTLYLKRIERRAQAWSWHTASQTPTVVCVPGRARSVADDLRQELALLLWRHIVLGSDPAWETYGLRRLTNSMASLARSYMRREGYWVNPRYVGREAAARMTPLRLAIGVSPDEGAPPDEVANVPEFPDPRDHFAAAELADLRDLVAALPDLSARERVAVYEEFWLGTPPIELAARFGMRPRSLRQARARARIKLGQAYTGTGAGTGARTRAGTGRGAA